MNLAIQLILINGTNIVGSVFSILINALLKVSTSDDQLYLLSKFEAVRPMLRFFFLLAQALIPVLSIILSPWRK